MNTGKTIAVIFFFMMGWWATSAQADWEYVGSAGISAGHVESPSLALDNSDMPYLAYRDGANGYKASVIRWNGTGWAYVGSAGFSAGVTGETNLALDSSNTPYVAYCDAAYDYRASVMRWNGATWEYVGNAGFSSSYASWVQLALDSSNAPYVAYLRGLYNMLGVERWNGTHWISINSGLGSTQQKISLVLDSSNTPYVAYGEYAYGTVRRWNATFSFWMSVGVATGFSEGAVGYIDLAVDSSNILYVAYQDGAHGSKVSVKRLNGLMIWEYVGSPGFSAGQADWVKLALDSSDTPYVTYRDGAHDSKASVMRWNGTTWGYVGSPGFLTPGVSTGGRSINSLVSDSNNTLYVAYIDAANGEKASVLKFAYAPEIDVQGNAQTIADGDPIPAVTDGTDFGSINAANVSVTHTFTIDNTGTTDLTLEPVTVSDAVNFSLTQPALTTIPAGGTTTFTVTFDPATAVRSVATVTIPNNDSNEQPYDFVIQGSGIVEPEIDVQGRGRTIADGDAVPTVKDGTDFGKVDVASGSVTHTFTIANVGSADLALGTVTVSNTANFSLTPPGLTTIPPSGTTTFTVTFDPAMSEPQTATVTIPNNDYNEQPYTYTIRGSDPTWTLVGSAGFSDGQVMYSSLALDNSQTPYLAYQDGAHGFKASVMRWTGTDWEYVGQPGFSANPVSSLSLALDSTNTPYVAYWDEMDEVVSVMRWTGTGWEYVGPSSISGGPADCPSLAFDRTNTPYVALMDAAYDDRASVMRWNGTTWEYVGSPGFSEVMAYRPSLVFSRSNIPYVAYTNSRANVMMFDGANWIQVGETSFFTSEGAVLSLALDSNDIPYVAYKYWGDGLQATVIRLNDGWWEQLGGDGFAVGCDPSLALSRNNTPYVAYCDPTHDYKLSVRMLDGTGWIQVGDAGFSASDVGEPKLVLDSSDAPYVAYGDGARAYHASLMRFAGVRPEIDVQGNSQSIPDGDATPDIADGTNFGGVSITSGSVTHTFTIQNLGPADLTIGTVTISDTTNFSLTQPATTVAPGNSTTFTVTFDPVDVGTHAATITIPNNDSDENPYDFVIQGIGTGIPEIDVQGKGLTIADGDTTPSVTDDTDFGNVNVTGGSVTHTFTIRNTGTADLTVETVTVSDATNFSVTQPGLTMVPASGTTTFTVIFDPTTAGTKTATVTIPSNDSDENPYNFTITGTGAQTAPNSFILWTK